MEPKINKVSIISMLIILSLIAIPGVYAYYFMDGQTDSFLTDRARQVIPEFQEDSRILDNRIVLRKNKAITVNNSRLVFKGVTDKMIRLDVYLLELDPEYAYPHYISMADPSREFRLGDTRFELLKLSRGALQLKIVDLFKS